jgi:hypothetical protein
LTFIDNLFDSADDKAITTEDLESGWELLGILGRNSRVLDHQEFIE